MERRTIIPGINPAHGFTASSSTASGSKGTGLPLVDCPKCGVRLISIRSKQTDTYGELFIKCPNNIKDDPGTCKFIRSHAQYESYLRGKDEDLARVQPTFEQGKTLVHHAKNDTTMEWYELKHEVENLKQQLHGVAIDISRLSMQRSQLKLFGMDSGVALGLCVGLLLGILVSSIWGSL